QSATFTAASGPRTDNIISRVTGTSASYIDGALRSTVPGADVWLMNPNGVFFSGESTIDVMGGLHVTTSDYLAFPDGARFDANPQATNDSLLSSAPPSAFGFTNAPAGTISISDARLYPSEISVVAGGIRIADASIGVEPFLDFVGGPTSIQLSAVASAGELPTGNTSQPSTISAFGNVELFGGGLFGSDIEINAGNVNVVFDSRILSYQAGQDAGDLRIFGDNIILDDSRIAAGDVEYFDSGFGLPEFGFGYEGGDLTIAGNATSTNGAAQSIDAVNSNIYSFSNDFDTRQMLLRGERINIVGSGGNPFDLGQGALVSETEFGRASDIILQGGSINVNSAEIYSNPSSQGVSGDIYIEGLGPTIGSRGNPAQEIYLELDATVGSSLGRFAGFGGDFGEPGSIEIRGSNVFLTDAFISTVAIDGDTGAQTRIYGDRILLNSPDRVQALVAETFGEVSIRPTLVGASVVGNGKAADVVLEGALSSPEQPLPAETIEVYGSAIQSSVLGPELGGTNGGDAGDVTIRSRNLQISSAQDDFFGTRGSTIGAPAAQSGPNEFSDSTSGNVNIFANDVLLLDSEITTVASGAGDAGDITIEGAFSLPGNRQPAESVGLQMSLITSSSSFAFSDAGAAGDITVNTLELFALGGEINSETAAGAGGDIRLFVESFGITSKFDFIDYVATPDFITSRTTGTGAAGDLIIAGIGSEGESLVPAREVYLTNFITASGSDEGGAAGNINIVSESVFLGEFGALSAVNSVGPAGNIQISTSNLTNNSDRFTNVNSGAGFGRISTSTSGSAPAGAIILNGLSENAQIDLTNPNSARLDDPGPVISSESFGSGSAGSIAVNIGLIDLLNTTVTVESSDTGGSGNIVVDAETLNLQSSVIEAQAANSAGGSILINAGELLYLQDSVIRASAQGLSGDDSGGNVGINGPDFVIMDRSLIQANANAGAGGNILMNTGALVQSADSFITATSQSSISGQVNVDTIDDITGTIVDLETPQTEMPEITESRCTPQALVKRSSLVVDEVSPQMTLDNSLVGNGLTPASQNPRLILAGCSRD
ncbi:MAG: filamentous hemagglutinin N-terminal domain-containing protein, partial [Halioglobus sp.]